jgi:hypothetical protein
MPRCSDDEQVDEFVHRRRFEPAGVERNVEDGALLLRRKASRQVGPELFHEQRNAVSAPAAMADRVLDDDFLQPAAVLELDRDRIGDRALVRIEVVAREAPVLDRPF